MVNTTTELFLVLNDTAQNSDDLLVPFHFNPIGALQAASKATTPEAVDEAINLVEVQTKAGATALRASAYNLLKTYERYDSVTSLSPAALRRYLHDLHLAAFDLHQRKGNTETAKYHLVKAVSSNSDREAGKLSLVEFYISQHRYGDAVATLNRVTEGESRSAYMLLDLAVLLLSLGAVNEASTALTYAQARDKVGLVREVSEKRQSKIATGIFTTPSREKLNERYSAAGQSLMTGQLNDALNELQTLVAFVPRWAAVWFMLGYAYRVGQDRALEHFTTQQTNEGETPILLLTDITTDHRRNELLRAIEAYEIASTCEQTPAEATVREMTIAEASKELIGCYLWLNRPEEALRQALRYASLRPSDVAAHANLSTALFAIGDLINAKNAAQMALSSDPDNMVAKLTLRRIHHAKP
jgi:tetratricopeptide (TPR) repeat protein